MCMSVNEYVYVKSPLNRCQRLQITPRRHLVAVHEAYLDISYLYDFCLRKLCEIVEFTFNAMHLRFSRGERL